MLRITVSKEEYDNNDLIKNPMLSSLQLRAKDGKIVKEIDFGGKTRYVLDFDGVEFAPPEDFKFGLQKESKQIFKKTDQNL